MEISAFDKSEDVLQLIQTCYEKNASELNLSYKKLTELPPEIGELTNLKELYIHNNRLLSLPPEIEKLTNLQILWVGNNHLTNLPAELGKLTNLTVLRLNNNNLTELPSEIENLTKIQTLWINENLLTSLPPGIENLTKLQTLWLNGTLLAELSPDIGKLTNLKLLSIDGNRLKTLPADMKNLTHLQELLLNYNMFEEFPPEILNLVNLTVLSISGNAIKTLPKEIGKLKNLQTFNISSNQITAIVPDIINLTSLTKLDIDNNPLVTPPVEIALRGVDAVNEYFRSLKKIENHYSKATKSCRQKAEINPSEKIYEAKLLIVGQGGVGKTSIVRRLIDNTFSDTEDPTMGIEVKQITLKHQDLPGLKLNVWDFGGQEIYHATHQFFLTKRSVYMLVWDARQEDEYGRLEHWLNIIRVFGEDSPVILVINKCDEFPGDINLKDLKEKFPGIIKGFYRVSCKKPGKGHDSFDKLKADIAKIASELPHMGSVWLEPWIKIREKFENGAKTHIPYEEFHRMCVEHNIEEKEEKLLDDYLHDLGVFLHFKDDIILQNMIIIKPTWVTNAVYKVVSSRAVLEREGILYESDLPDIWKDGYPQEIYGTLLSLMKNFELSFSIEGTKNHVIASALATNSIDANCDHRDSSKVIYEYNFLPKTVIPRFIVRAHDLIKRTYGKYLCWRTGVILERSTDGVETQAYIKAYPNDKKLEIVVFGKNKYEFFTIIRNHLENIHKITKKLEVELKIPCVCSSNCKHLFKYSFLIKLQEQGINDVFCEITANHVSIKKLFAGIKREGGQRMSDRGKEDHTSAPSNEKYDVFIAHSKNDVDFIKSNILPDLISRGICYWFDDAKIEPGEQITKKIETGLSNSRYILVCLSTNLVKSNWCRAEYAFILHQYFKEKTNKRVIPLKLDSCDDSVVPPLLSDIKWTDYSDRKSYDELLIFLKNN
ncbi:MAG: leucine-rich repeat domain-containing protein [Nitrospirae bacterium]|nr:leucine-rich repeat domain-containing protein [Nitrospirota bacterium]MBF0536448.1 leucine-rich repeat domain-containing protein [Nitrospirota bacterium]MBF0618404.1 leucine-rich repeat domain-containing protein [Nitrospirota bacterium]